MLFTSIFSFLLLTHSLSLSLYIIIIYNFVFSLCTSISSLPIFHTLPALDCGLAPVLENGNVATQNGTLVGSKVTYTCNSNYVFTLDSSKERTCQPSGDWSDEEIQCGEGGKGNVNIQ